jgi:hypothetical protein
LASDIIESGHVMRFQATSVTRLSAASMVVTLAFGLGGCAGVVVLGAMGSIGAAGGLAATEKDRDAKAGSGSDAIPPAQRVPPSQQTAVPAADDAQPVAEPRRAVTVQPLAPR